MTTREKRTSTVCIFKLENKQFWTLWTCIFVEVHFVTVPSQSTAWNYLFWTYMENVTWLDILFLLFFTKCWSQIHSSVIRTHFAPIIILNKQEVIFRWCCRCLFMISWHSLKREISRIPYATNSSKDKRIDRQIRSSGLTFFDRVIKQKDRNIQPRCFFWHSILCFKTESPLIVLFCFFFASFLELIFFFIFKERVFSGPGLSIWAETFLTIPRL